MRTLLSRKLIAAVMGVLLFPLMTLAVIKVLTPLKSQIENVQLIFIAHVSDVLPERPAMVLTLKENLKGEAPFTRLPINLTGDDEAKKDKHTQILLDRVEKDTPIIVFSTKLAKKYLGVAFTNGTWFSLEGRIEKENDKEVVRWTFTHCEPYLRRTFKGTTEELKSIIVDAIAKKKEPPEPNEKEEPGYGPALKKKCDETGAISPTQAPLIGVIQLPFMGAIIALAAIFPTVFGGLALMMKRWMVALSFSGIYSILLTIYFQFNSLLYFDFLKSPSGFFLALSGLALVFIFWSARRYRRALEEGRSEEMQPRRIDRILLSVACLIFAGVLAFPLSSKDPVLSEPWLHLTVPTLTVLAITFYLFVTYFRVKKLPEPRRALGTSAELVVLWSFVGSCLLAMGLTTERPVGVIVQGDTSSGTGYRFNPQPVWVFAPDHEGMLASSPCLTPDAIVIPVVRQFGGFNLGKVYAIDPLTGKEKWGFDDEEELKPMFCTPTYHEGFVLFGEGFHTDKQSRVFCLDAKTGKKIWEFKTQSHAESKPAVSDGKVVFGAGNDGIYCVDLKTGKEIWHKGGMHVDAPPAIWNGKVYVGSGKSQEFPDLNRIFCLNLTDGSEVWGERLERSAYAPPIVEDGIAYFGTGNGTFDKERDMLGGQLLARDAVTGKKIWDCPLPGTVMGKPASDRHLLYVGTRDGKLYAIDKARGDILWDRSLGSPVLASPALHLDPKTQRGELLFAIAEQSGLVGVSPYTGSPFWSADKSAFSSSPYVKAVSSPLITSTTVDGKTAIHLILALEEGLSANTSQKPRVYCFEVSR
jgi:outer membrane protein assembly factor BamB